MPALIAVVLCLGLAALWAHPAVGIVADAYGAIYYSDNVHVWRVDPAGRRSIAVANVHSHELWLAPDGNLYGEHLWYEGDRTGRWGHRVWKRSPEGKVTDVIAPRAGFRDYYRDFSFVRAREGWMYWMVRQGSGILLVRNRSGRPAETLADLGDVRPGWLSVSPSGDLLFAVGGIVYRMRGAARAAPLHRNSLGQVMGVWGDSAGNVYAALPERRKVVLIRSSGEIETVAESPSDWQPASGVVAPDGRLWLLEFNSANEQRVRVAPQ